MAHCRHLLHQGAYATTTTTATRTSQICIFDKMKNNSFARFARAVFIFGHFADVLNLFCS